MPTGAGWAVVFLSLLLLLTLFSLSVHPFLAPCSPLGGEALIVEGWVPDYCLQSVTRIFGRYQYRAVFVTGGPLESGSYLKDYKNYAALGAATLKRLSIPDSIIVVVPSTHTLVDRTYTSAVALRTWIDSTRCPFRKFDLCSQATHTRRSTLLFKRALGKSIKIGSVAVIDPDYDPRFWWKSSKGVRSVIDECIALMYAFFFITFT
ncbi:MAG: YdcF family protein [Chitinispirillaceae bacterium]|nr:YdcF family protein [Chitinispirillaceae bacterium]